MQSGKLKLKVTLQRRNETEAPSGQELHTYVDVTDVYAEIADLSGREFFAARQVQSQVTTRITIRYRVDVDATWRVKHVVQHGSPEIVETYDVEYVMRDKKTNRTECQLFCSKNPAPGFNNGG